MARLDMTNPHTHTCVCLLVCWWKINKCDLSFCKHKAAAATKCEEAAFESALNCSQTARSVHAKCAHIATPNTHALTHIQSAAVCVDILGNEYASLAWRGLAMRLATGTECEELLAGAEAVCLAEY